MKYLIVNADDYGLAPPVSAGIRQAFTDGILTSTTVMMNMPDALAAVRLAPPGLGLGVHLTLTGGYPLTPPEQLPNLMRHARNGRFPHVDDLRREARTLDLDMEEIVAEWRAQIELFVQLSGRPPDHLDSHHNSSYFSFDLFNTMLALAAEYECAIRLPFRAADLPDSGDQIELPADFPTTPSPADLAKLAGVPAPDHFVDSFYDHGATLETLLGAIDAVRDGVTELMSHPAAADPALAAITSYNQPRSRELALLQHPDVRTRIRERGIQLITFAQMMELRR